MPAHLSARLPGTLWPGDLLRTHGQNGFNQTSPGPINHLIHRQTRLPDQIHHRQQHLSVGLAKLLDGFFGSLGTQLQNVIFSLHAAVLLL
jgi:hypothetical protein